MRRWILTAVSLAVIGLWLLLAYVPALPRPSLAYPVWSAPGLGLLAALGLLVFVALQGWLLYATDRVLGPNATPAQAQVRAEMGVPRAREFFWSALPLAMTLGLAALVYGVI